MFSFVCFLSIITLLNDKVWEPHFAINARSTLSLLRWAKPSHNDEVENGKTI